MEIKIKIKLMSKDSVDERKRMGFTTAQRKYILRIEQGYLEEANKHLTEIIELRKQLKAVQGNEDWREKLFSHMSKEHGLSLLENELQEIKEIILPTKYPYKL